MRKYNDRIKLKINGEGKKIEIWKGDDDVPVDIFQFEGKGDFVKWLLGLVKDMGLSSMEFASACNNAVNEIDGWDSL